MPPDVAPRMNLRHRLSAVAGPVLLVWGVGLLGLAALDWMLYGRFLLSLGFR